MLTAFINVTLTVISVKQRCAIMTNVNIDDALKAIGMILYTSIQTTISELE